MSWLTSWLSGPSPPPKPSYIDEFLDDRAYVEEEEKQLVEAFNAQKFDAEAHARALQRRARALMSTDPERAAIYLQMALGQKMLVQDVRDAQHAAGTVATAATFQAIVAQAQAAQKSLGRVAQQALPAYREAEMEPAPPPPAAAKKPAPPPKPRVTDYDSDYDRPPSRNGTN